MNKKTIITILFVLAAMAGQAQEIKMNEPSFSDYIPLLNAKGYMAYSFDMHEFNGKYVIPVIKEYENGKETDAKFGSDISFGIKDKLIIGFFPSEKDSIANYSFSLSCGGGFNANLPKRPIYMPKDSTNALYQYESRPFEITPPFKKGEFIPLVLYGSWWYDADFDIARFCGENFIKPDLSSDIVKYIPHFFVLGIKIK